MPRPAVGWEEPFVQKWREVVAVCSLISILACQKMSISSLGLDARNHTLPILATLVPPTNVVSFERPESEYCHICNGFWIGWIGGERTESFV